MINKIWLLSSNEWSRLISSLVGEENRDEKVRDRSDEKDRKVGCCLGRIVSPSLIS